MTPATDVFYFGYAMLYAWCPQALQNWVEGSLSRPERLAVHRFLGLLPQWHSEVEVLLHRRIPSRIIHHVWSWREQLKHPGPRGKNPQRYSVWEDEESPLPVYSEELRFYDLVSGFYPLKGGSWSLILKKESYLRRLYPRYRLQAVAALMAGREMDIPLEEAVVIGWKGAEHILSLSAGEEDEVRMLLRQTREVLQGRRPPLAEIGCPTCRYCFQKSCDRHRYLQELDDLEEISL